MQVGGGGVLDLDDDGALFGGSFLPAPSAGGSISAPTWSQALRDRPGEAPESGYRVDDPYKQVGQHFRDSAKFAGHVALLYQNTQLLQRLGPCVAPGVLVASMVHFVNMNNPEFSSWKQLRNFFRILKGGEDSAAFKKWYAARVERYGSVAAAERVYAKVDAQRSADAMLEEGTGTQPTGW